MIVEFIGRSHQARAHFPNFLTASGIEVDKVHVASMHFGNFHQFHSSVSKYVAVGSSRSWSSSRVASFFAA